MSVLSINMRGEITQINCFQCKANHIFAFQLLHSSFCYMQFLLGPPISAIPGTDLANWLRIQTPTQAMVRNCGDWCRFTAGIYPCLCPACHTDQGSCSCCLILQEVNRLKTYFNTTLALMEKEYLLTKQSLRNIEGE